MKTTVKLNVAAVMTFLLVSACALGGAIKVWNTGDVLTPSDLNANFSHIHNLMVGGHGPRLVDADVSNTAAISTTKLAAGALIPRAWGNVTTVCSAGTCTSASTSGVTSITFVATGRYLVTLSAIRNATFMNIANTLDAATSNQCHGIAPLSTTTFEVNCFTAAGAAVNARFSFLVLDN